MDQSLAKGPGHVSVLSCFPQSVGREVAVAVVTHLGAELGNPNTPSLLCTDIQVKWTMEVLCYGLTLPLDRDTVKLCVDIYTDWLMALVSPRRSTPPPVSRDPNQYVQRILRHLSLLFLPRSDQVSLVHWSLCQQVLGAVRSLARESRTMSKETWETVLQFLLRMNHALLAPPSTAAAVSDRSMAVLMEVWLLACSRCFPSHAMWQTCRQMLSSCRHQPAVVQQWSRAAAGLTSRLLPLTFGPFFPPFRVPDEDAALVPADMEDERIPQTWLRFLHIFSNPADLRRLDVGAVTPPPKGEESGGEGRLPDIFYRALKRLSELVDAFLGVFVEPGEPVKQFLPNLGVGRIHVRDRLPSLGVPSNRSPFRDRPPAYGFSRPRSGSAPPVPVNIQRLPDAPPSRTSPPQRKKSLRAANVPTATNKPTVMSSSCFLASLPFPGSRRPRPSPLRCNVDSLLHLFGCWLFDAALISADSEICRQNDVTRWAAGRAEAFGTLCRIFSWKKTAEEIQPVYLSRFYLVLLQSLQMSEEVCAPVLASILMNSTSLFCCDLKGVNLLLPPFISALEKVLLHRDPVNFQGCASPVDLRRASIFILLSLLPLPLQFGSVPSQVSLNGGLNADDVTAGNFLSLRPRLISLLIGALQTETNTCNTQLLLAAALNLVQDLAAGQSRQETRTHNDGAIGAGRSSGTSSDRVVKVDSSSLLWIHVVRWVSQCLTSHWRNDPAVCLSALEVLGGLAKVDVQVEDAERRCVVRSVCTYIEFQCSRPHPLHSRDLHSIIVAAFFCLNTWLTQHPALLDNQACLLEVLDIVELGISGRKSKQEEDIWNKEKKELNPASLRVKEAAEATLTCVMQVSGACPCIDMSGNKDTFIGFHRLRDVSLTKYFVLERSVILAMLEEGPGPEKTLHPSLTVVIRGPSGCHTWSLQLHLQPRAERTCTQFQQTLVPVHRIVHQEDAERTSGVKYQLYPDIGPSVKADLSIPVLQETVTEEVQLEFECLKAALKNQQRFEAQVQTTGRFADIATCKPQPPVSYFQVARLFLSHMGLLTPESIKDLGVGGVLPQLMSLDPSLPGFCESLRSLDELPSQTRDSAFVFYVRAGQRTAAEILRNVDNSCSVQPYFLDFLSSLGRPVDVEKRRVGGANASRAEFHVVLGDSGGAVFDGRKFVLMFKDALAEIAFIVPSTLTYTFWLNSSEVEPPTESPSTQQHHYEGSPESGPTSTPCPGEDRKTRCYMSPFVSSDSKLLVVWVESFQDIEGFPLSDLLPETNTRTEMSLSNIHLIFIHPLKTGLYRICFHGDATSKLGLVMPLVNGSIVSKRSLGFLLREMVMNCCQRRRLESDFAPLPHVKRKHIISDIILRYSSRHSEPAFYSALFQPL
ncbi:ral GTPase-activating protein subunit beta [Cololabis saira]|uniref:ral GTPase-activating protein subunit beta n=1 Tax=Cololabis saira TaxID=129043 RepID=UPI002AD40919|nr:ral GTPase-activating protein subunit beta [Cololabis saira]